jgi:hypothetical protein
LVFVRAGKVFASGMDDSGEWKEKKLADFNGARPVNVKAPTWARQW